LIGTLIGIPLGFVLSHLIASLVEATSPVLNQFGEMVLPTDRLVLAIGMGVGITLLAGYVPAHRASRSSPLSVSYTSSQVEGRNPKVFWEIVPTILLTVLLVYLLIAPPADRLKPPWSNYLTLLTLFLWVGGILLAVPGWIQGFAQVAVAPLQRLFGATGMIGVQNIQRSRGRVTFTVFTLAVSVAMIVGVTGFMTFSFEELFFRTMDRAMREQGGLGVFPLDLGAGMQAYSGLFQASVPKELVSEIEAVVGDRAVVVESYFVLAPQLSFMGDRYFSFILDPNELGETNGLFFEFSPEDWSEAEQIMQEGCGLLVTPIVAVRNDVWLHDQMVLETPLGPITCTIAGIGPTFVGASIISAPAGPFFQIGSPVSLVIMPTQGVSLDELHAELTPIVDEYEGVWLDDLTQIRRVQEQAMETVRSTMNGMLLLAILSAAFGVVNILMVNLQERKQELRVLRAVGATRGQVRGAILVEAALYGVLGGLSGLVMGVGLVLGYVLISGATQWGMPDFPTREAAVASLVPALRSGLYGTVLAPLITGLTAWFVITRSKSSISPGMIDL
jgi:putative ABC transport system permease protein